MQNTSNQILHGPLFPALTKFTLPILLSLVLQALYGAVDLWMVGQFATNADVSAVSTGSQTLLIVCGFITGLSLGVTVLLGQAMGQKEKHTSANIIGTGIWIFLALALLMTILLAAGAEPLALLLNAPAAALEKTSHYLLICGMGTIFVVGFNVLNSIFCGLGDSRTPLIFVLVASIVNIIGDYLLIHLLGWGAVGAALATITAQAISVSFALALLPKFLPFTLTRASFHLNPTLALALIKLGLPIALLRTCTEISYLIILGIVNLQGEVASSGVGIAEKLVMFILLIPTAYMSSISVFVAQNQGAQQQQRVQRTLWLGLASSTCITAVMSYLSYFHGDSLSLLFVDDSLVVAASAEFLQATAIECFFLSLAYCFNGYFNGLQHTTLVMVRGVSAALLVRIPYAYYVGQQAGASLFHIGLATAWAAIYMLLFCVLEYIIRQRSKTSSCSTS